MADIMGGIGRAIGAILRQRKRSGNVGKAKGGTGRLGRGMPHKKQPHRARRLVVKMASRFASRHKKQPRK
jgi:hypothetical protein